MPTPVERLRSVVRLPEPGPMPADLVGLDRNERLAPLPDRFLDRLRTALTSDLLTAYPVTTGLTAALERHHGLPQGGLLLTPGSDGGVKALFHTFADEGSEVVMLDPSYAMYSVYAEMVGARAVKVGFDDDLRLDVDELLARIGARTRLVMIANPNQPTGTLLPDGAVAALAERAGSVGAVLAVDEAYHPFSPTTVLPLLAEHPALVVLRTFSKAAGLAGLRIGYACAAPEIVQGLFKVRSVHDVNAVAVQAALAVLDDPSVVEDYVAAVTAGGERLTARVRALGLEPRDTITNFLLVRVAPAYDPGRLVAALRTRGYLVRGPFSAPCLTGHIRVTLGPAELMDAFADALADALPEAAAS